MDVKIKVQELESRFINNPADAFAIYQLKGGAELRDIRFEPLSWLQSVGRSVERKNYDLIYTDRLTAIGSTTEKLNALWERFNNNHPADFNGHSMSVSDIVALKQNGVISCHYVDSFGFQEVPDFYTGKNSPDRTACEETTDKLKPVLERLAAKAVNSESDKTGPFHNIEKER